MSGRVHRSHGADLHNRNLALAKRVEELEADVECARRRADAREKERDEAYAERRDADLRIARLVSGAQSLRAKLDAACEERAEEGACAEAAEARAAEMASACAMFEKRESDSWNLCERWKSEKKAAEEERDQAYALTEKALVHADAAEKRAAEAEEMEADAMTTVKWLGEQVAKVKRERDAAEKRAAQHNQAIEVLLRECQSAEASAEPAEKRAAEAEREVTLLTKKQSDGFWLCYCGYSRIPLGQPCPKCRWDGHEDGDAAEIAWGKVQEMKDNLHAIVVELERACRDHERRGEPRVVSTRRIREIMAAVGPPHCSADGESALPEDREIPF